MNSYLAHISFPIYYSVGEDIDVPLSVGLAKFKAHMKAYLTPYLL